MPNFVISDLHLMDRSQKFLFNSDKETAFCRFSEMIFESDGRLVLAGDIFDFTGMTPCQKGNLEFFQEVLQSSQLNQEAMKLAGTLRSTKDLLLGCRTAFPRFFEVLSKLAEQKKLIYLPGNHDCDFLRASSRDDLADVLGVYHDRIEWTKQYEQGHCFVVSHGNQFDPPNNTDRGCRNPGYVFTSALYHSVLPALQMMGIDSLILEAIPAVRPEEQVVVGLQEHLSTEDCQKMLLALTRLLARNRFFQGLSSLPGWILTHEIPLVSRLMRNGVTVQRVRSLLPKDEKLMADARSGAEKMRVELVRRDPRFETALIILGHTHELDLQPNYFNLGTWLDHIGGLKPEHLMNPEISLPVLSIYEDGQACLYNVRDLQTEKKTVFQCPQMTGPVMALTSSDR